MSQRATLALVLCPKLLGCGLLVASLFVGLVSQAHAQVSNPVSGDRPGGDFLSFFLPPNALDNPRLCRIACQRHARCTAYTFGRRDGEPFCWLKETTFPLVASWQYASGVRTGPSLDPDPLVNEPPKDFTREVGMDRWGGDYSSRALTASQSDADCAALCRAAGVCDAFTFTNRSGVKTCHLKAGRVPSLTPCSHCISGRKIGYLPSPFVPYGNDIRLSTDVRPLLVVILQFQTGSACASVTRPAFHTAQTTAGYWRRYFFGPREPNISSYFHRTSQGKFTYVEAGVLGPFPVTCLGTVVNAFAAGLQQAVSSGFDFRRFDRNRNGTVSPDELAVIVIDNLTAAAATSNRGQSTVTTDRSGSLTINPYMIAIGFQSPFDNFAHELGHAIGMWDAYGRQCFSTNLTLASCTANAPATGVVGSQQFTSNYFDGYHRIFFGWTQPLLVNMRGSGGCYRLTAVPDFQSKPIVFYNPDELLIQQRLGRGAEYYLVELRDQSRTDFGSVALTDLAGTPAGTASGYENNFAGGAPGAVGALIWWVQNSPSGPGGGPWNRDVAILRGVNNVFNTE